MEYAPVTDRYASMKYVRCGRSGVKLPAVSLGLWHNFGGEAVLENARAMIRTAFDLGITHFDLANNYGPPPGSAEENFGRILAQDFRTLRDEMIISTKAGYLMWPGPYGEWGSKKYLVASLDQSLRRMGLDYVDIFYSHRPDPDTPLEETMAALDLVVRQGKALYAGISNYKVPEAREAIAILRRLGHAVPHPPAIVFDVQPLGGRRASRPAPGGRGRQHRLLPARARPPYRQVPGGDPRRLAGGRARACFSPPRTSPSAVLAKVRALNAVAAARGQSLAQMALAWVLRGGRVTSVVIGASKPAAGGRLRRCHQEHGVLRGGAFEDRGHPGEVARPRSSVAFTATVRACSLNAYPRTAKKV